jgi:D-3-phosphoglycerate dehydrogenase
MKKFKFLEQNPGVEVEMIDECVIDSNNGMLRNHQMERMGPDSFEYTQEYIDALASANIIITAFSPIPSAVFEKGNVEAVCILRSGVDNVDLAKAGASGVKVINAPSRLAVPVSEYTVGLLIAEMKNIARSHALCAQGIWKKAYPNRDYNINLKGASVGIVGCGAIGSRVAKIMDAFEATVLVYDPYADAAALTAKGYKVLSLDELCQQADVISLHYRLTDETKSLITAKHFALMKPTVFIVNTARADLIDEAALMDALRSKKIGGAALDVYHQEPLSSDNPYIGLDNVTLTSHMAGDCSNIFDITFEIVGDCLKKYFTEGVWSNVFNS